MVVTCPACGQTTHDQEFCDHCNADLGPPSLPSPASDQPLPDQVELRLGRDLLTLLDRPEAGVVVPAEGRSWRIHWIPAAQWPLWRPRLEDRQRVTAAALPPCRTTADPEGTWVTVEAQASCATPWLATRGLQPVEQVQGLIEFLEPLTRALEGLHEAGLLCLPFDPRHLEMVEDPTLRTVRFTNLDLGVTLMGPCPENLQVVPAFSPPEVSRILGRELGPAVDVFHTALFAYCWLAGLLPRGFAGAGPDAFDYDFPSLRLFNPNLPPGIAAVLERGLALDADDRWPSPTALLEALREAADQARLRWEVTAPIAWEVAGHTRTGRAKAALHRANEDDVMVRHFTIPDRTLVAVADGLTCCTVGSGGLASLLTFLALENALDDDCTQDSFAERLAGACRRGAEIILAWALEHGFRRSLLNGKELMASTLLAGWIEGRMLTLGNLGDSRAYLIDGERVEQLTVDGDVRSFWLARGIPPEEVAQLGGLGRALRTCVGGFVQDDGGEPRIDPDHLRPALTTWALRPGDVVVLCSDGLVEEDVFLEPADVARLVNEYRDESAAALAERLAEAADSLQELPSDEQPDGFGDNVTCAVIKVYEVAPDVAGP